MADSRDLPAAPSQSHQDVELQVALRQRCLDSLSVLAGATAGYGTWPSMTALDAVRWELHGGAAWSPLEDLELQAEGFGGAERQPGYDLSHSDRGVLGRLAAQMGSTELSAQWTSRWQDYPDRFNPLSITNFKTDVPRRDQVDDASAGLDYRASVWSVGAGWAWWQRLSNAIGVDPGPWQNALNDPSYIDDTFLRDMDSARRQGPWVSASWQALQALHLDWRGSATWVDYFGRPAKDNQDRFLADRALRWDQVYESELGASWGLGLAGLSLELRWTHQDSRSNDDFFAYGRDETRAGLRTDF